MASVVKSNHTANVPFTLDDEQFNSTITKSLTFWVLSLHKRICMGPAVLQRLHSFLADLNCLPLQAREQRFAPDRPVIRHPPGREHPERWHGPAGGALHRAVSRRLPQTSSTPVPALPAWQVTSDSNTLQPPSTCGHSRFHLATGKHGALLRRMESHLCAGTAPFSADTGSSRPQHQFLLYAACPLYTEDVGYSSAAEFVLSPL
jgi:hypothetical protein